MIRITPSIWRPYSKVPLVAQEPIENGEVELITEPRYEPYRGGYGAAAHFPGEASTWHGSLDEAKAWIERQARLAAAKDRGEAIEVSGEPSDAGAVVPDV